MACFILAHVVLFKRPFLYLLKRLALIHSIVMPHGGLETLYFCSCLALLLSCCQNTRLLLLSLLFCHSLGAFFRKYLWVPFISSNNGKRWMLSWMIHVNSLSFLDLLFDHNLERILQYALLVLGCSSRGWVLFSRDLFNIYPLLLFYHAFGMACFLCVSQHFTILFRHWLNVVVNHFSAHLTPSSRYCTVNILQPFLPCVTVMFPACTALLKHSWILFSMILRYVLLRLDSGFSSNWEICFLWFISIISIFFHSCNVSLQSICKHSYCFFCLSWRWLIAFSPWCNLHFAMFVLYDLFLSLEFVLLSSMRPYILPCLSRMTYFFSVLSLE